jgi:DNA-binding response OmpR family regulator/nitrogen-specific signal transduction histidine kinase
MMILFTWVLFLRFSNLRKKLAQQSSLDHLKSRFFANISHEFRTPLTLIIGPVEDLLQDKNTQKFREPLQYIHRNAKRLLQLINQLLDLSRLDAGSYRVDTNRNDIIPFVRQIMYSFSSIAHHKNILLETKVDPVLRNGLQNEVLTFYFDEDIFEKILYNLLSNAFKFTDEGGSITVSISLAGKDLLELKVEDSGTGIPAEKLPFIFDRFYQADSPGKKVYEGTGIGLALVKELVELHHGKISALSNVDKGTSFSCYFALNKKIISAGVAGKMGSNQTTVLPVPEFNDTEGEKPPDPARPKILVVEDQQDVRNYICDRLTGTYTVIEAGNGQEGFEAAKKEIPDLVISDVMMPVTDGFELCALLKNDTLTSHIPVILLTARAEDMDKITGLETGADAYLIKPFNAKELSIRVRNLIELRNKLRRKFSGKLVVKPGEVVVTSQDSRFMHRLLDTVEKHIADEKFSVEQLGREFGMSPSQINRKLKAIVNQSAGAFIRSVRMERAMELLKNDQGSIAEIAYETGFGEPAYFSRVFKSYFGYPPSEVKRTGKS